MTPHPGTGMLPRLGFEEAVRIFTGDGVAEPAWGKLDASRIQLCPQSMGTMTEQKAEALAEAHPGVEFRLHASVRTIPGERAGVSAARLDDRDMRQFESIARTSRALGGHGYVVHAGARTDGGMASMLRNLRGIEKIFAENGGGPVGVEPMYPAAGGPWVTDGWDEWEELLTEGVGFALDLSHARIMAKRRGPPPRATCWGGWLKAGAAWRSTCHGTTGSLTRTSR